MTQSDPRPECFACGETHELRVIDYDGYTENDLVCRDCWDAGEPDTGQPDFSDLQSADECAQDKADERGDHQYHQKRDREMDA